MSFRQLFFSSLPGLALLASCGRVQKEALKRGGDITDRQPPAPAQVGVPAAIHSPPMTAPPRAGDVMMPFSFPDLLTSLPVDSARFRDKVLLLEFWDSTCDLCNIRMEQLRELSAKYRGRGLVVVGFAQDENIEALKNFLRREKVDWTQCADRIPSHRYADKMKVYFIPGNLLVDSAGVILAVNAGGEELEKILEGLFAAR